ncbi:MAG: tRNA 5-methoxyuridine(34)/uridine 5-oxyacetic acid(34) synthase CmoB [Sedimenticolaceae bacterium]
MIDIENTLAVLREHELNQWADHLAPILTYQQENPHGDLARWKSALDGLPVIQSGDVDLSVGPITVNAKLSAEEQSKLQSALEGLRPWRKGPFQLADTAIDTEWRSDWKWDRVLPHIQSLKYRKVLDVGCGNGYHCWRMRQEDPALVVGIDPSPLFTVQFHAVKKLITDAGRADLANNTLMIPVGFEAVPDGLESFDTVFSMGVLYHRRSPIDFLQSLKKTLKPGGELVLETLVIEGDAQACLIPEDRYAQMRNVWFIPSVEQLALYMQRVGFSDVRCVDVNITTTDEQRSTEWMSFDSLSDFLDPNDPLKTVEGYPSPMRAVMIATA